jgi:hypothetical protein
MCADASYSNRALKAVLVMAGTLKRNSPDLSEDVVMMRALRDMNLPKFVFEVCFSYSSSLPPCYPPCGGCQFSCTKGNIWSPF